MNCPNCGRFMRIKSRDHYVSEIYHHALVETMWICPARNYDGVDEIHGLLPKPCHVRFAVTDAKP